MELTDLVQHINKRLKKHSLAHAKVEEGFFNDKIIIDHPDPSDYFLGSKITITFSLGWWYLDYQHNVDSDVTVKMQVQSNDDSDDLHQIVRFVNDHTMHKTPEKSEINFKDNNFIKNRITE